MLYVKRRANNLFFSKRWPKHLQAVIGSVGFSYPLGSVTQTEAEVSDKVTAALREYAVKVKLASNSNPEDYQQNEIDIMVEANLRRLKQTQGLPHFVLPDQHLIDYHKTSGKPESQEFISSKTQLAHSLVPQLDDVIWKEQTGQKLTMRDKVAGATWVALQSKAKKKPKMLHDCWKVYTKFKGLDVPTRNWERFCDLIQDRSINISSKGHQDLSKELNETLREYRDIRIAKVKVSTVKREINSVKACLNFTTLENNFDWNLRPTLFQTPKEGEVEERLPLSLEHQKMLVAYCLSPEHREKPEATLVLLYLQGGVMPSEVARMDTEAQLKNLWNDVAPHVRIVGKVKKDARKRPVPVVLGLDVVREGIEKAINFANVPMGTRTGAMKRFLDAATQTDGVYVSHGLRHSFSANCRNSNCRDDDKCTLGGWASSGSASAVSRRYGAEGRFDQTNIERLHKVSLDIHRNLI